MIPALRKRALKKKRRLVPGDCRMKGDIDGNCGAFPAKAALILSKSNIFRS